MVMAGGLLWLRPAASEFNTRCTCCRLGPRPALAASGGQRRPQVGSGLVVSYAPVHTLNVAPCPSSSHDSFVEEHERCLSSSKAIVVRISDSKELMLAPVYSIKGAALSTHMLARRVCVLNVKLSLSMPADDGSQIPVFWGYELTVGLASLAASMLDSSRLALIFDLDETLLVANSSSNLDTRIDNCRRQRSEIYGMGRSHRAQCLTLTYMCGVCRKQAEREFKDLDDSASQEQM